MNFRSRVSLILCALLMSHVALAADWPMWRYDAGRTASSPEELPAELRLQWNREYSPRTPVWDDPLNQDLMPFDAQFEPIIVGETVILGFNDMDAVVGLNVVTGEERWRYYLDGPTRLPPAAWQDRVYVPSDDGRLYCLDIRDGTPHWIFDAAPYGRLLLGNRRLISTWPVRGGPVVMDGVVYFASGIWPFMGTFLYALEAATGKLVWLNDGNGPQWMVQPHGASSFAGVGPQGALVIAGGALLVPGGRSVPACFDRATGAFRHYEHGANNKTGGAFVAALGDVFFNHHRDAIVSLYETATGKKLAATLGRYPVLTPATFYFSGASVTAVDAAQLLKTPDKVEVCRRWTMEADASGDLIRAGARLYAGGDKVITAIDAPDDGSSPGRIAWQHAIPGKVRRLIAGNGVLVAVTDAGRILAFGGQAGEARTFPAPVPEREVAADRRAEANELLRSAGIREGYALCYGVSDAELLKALVEASSLHIIAVDCSAERVAALRRQLDAEGFRGDRLAVLPGNVMELATPAYFASLTLIYESKTTGFLPNSTECLERIFHAMRPYGGVTLVQGLSANERKVLLQTIKHAGLHGLRVAASGDNVLLIREGPLEGAASWTHLLGDVAQSGKSDDLRVKLPLGLLWFGGNSHVDVLPRHGHGPPEQILGGRMFIEGMDCMSARDVYTGRVLWKTTLPGLDTFGTYYDATYRDEPTSTGYGQVHIPGANARNTNFVVTTDEVYVVEDTHVQVLDSETGSKLRRFSLPRAEDAAADAPETEWGYIGVYEDVLLGGADSVKFSDVAPAQKGKEAAWELLDRSAGKRLAALDRHTGELRWQIRAQHAFLNNGIAAGDGLVFCLDKVPPSIEGRLKRRGQVSSGGFRLLALDIQTGEIRWQTAENVFGSFLCYSKEHGVLVQSTRPSRDSLPGEEGKRMIAYRGADGSVLWDRETAYRTFPLLHGEQIVTEGNLFHLMTGEPVPRLNPLTGAEIPWEWRREYGCNYPIASEFLLTFRSGAAGFCDFSGSGGTGNLGGFRSSCTSNLIAADGLLNAPDYTRTCSCSYQNQTSLAMIYDPAVEMWTYNDFQTGQGPIRQVGINFGAPGDRLADNGTLWLDYPSVGGPSPEVGVRLVPDAPKWFRHHSSRYTGEALRWVAASGAEGLSEAHIALGSPSDAPRRYTIRLYFAEPEDLEIGQRIFDVSIQGKPVLRHFDLVKDAGGPRRVVVKEYKGIAVTDDLVVALLASSPGREPLLCGVEAIAEGW